MPTLAQKRASQAYNQVHPIATVDRYESIRKNYGSLARGIASMIQLNGLGPTLAFLRAKAKGDATKAPMVLYQQLNSWLSANVLPGAPHQSTDFLQWVITQNTSTYHMATIEALEYSVWIKRFAEAEGLVSEDAGEED